METPSAGAELVRGEQLRFVAGGGVKHVKERLLLKLLENR